MRRLRWILGSLLGAAVTVVVGFILLAPQPVCACIGPDLRFQRQFQLSAGDEPDRVRAAILARLPRGSSADAVTAVCERLNDSTVTTACTISDGPLACRCGFRTQASLVGWNERRVTLEFRLDEQRALAGVTVEREASLF